MTMSFVRGVETCLNGVCQAGPGNPCSGAMPFCDETINQCVECLADTDCDDGDYCNWVETCGSGSCQGGSNPCSGNTPACDETSDTCVCQTDANCSDGLACTGTETCDPANPTAAPTGCVAGTPVSCPTYPQACTEPTGICEDSCDVVEADADYVTGSPGMTCVDTGTVPACVTAGVDTLLVANDVSQDRDAHRTAASDIGFALAEPRTSDENECYMYVTILSTANTYYIGANAEADGSTWRWENGDAVDASANWHSGEPNGSGDN